MWHLFVCIYFSQTFSYVQDIFSNTPILIFSSCRLVKSAKHLMQWGSHALLLPFFTSDPPRHPSLLPFATLPQGAALFVRKRSTGKPGQHTGLHVAKSRIFVSYEATERDTSFRNDPTFVFIQVLTGWTAASVEKAKRLSLSVLICLVWCTNPHGHRCCRHIRQTCWTVCKFAKCQKISGSFKYFVNLVTECDSLSRSLLPSFSQISESLINFVFGWHKNEVWGRVCDGEMFLCL